MNSIDSLKEALQVSPNNIPLKMLLANAFLSQFLIEEAEKQYVEVIALDNANLQAKIALSKLYFQNNQLSKSTVILEDVLKNNPNNIEALLLITKVLVKENSMNDALPYYQQVIQLNPNFVDNELDLLFRNPSNFIENTDEDFDFSDSDYDQFPEAKSFQMFKPNINFTDIGGMDEIKKEIELKIIHPLNFPDLYKAYGKKIGGGILLYGPPGCGKTYLAKATAGQINANFIAVGLNDILDMWVGNSEKNLHEVFEYARSNKPCVLFFDEIDALAASRSDMKQSNTKVLINQFLQELDGVDTDNEGILILGATNAPWHLDNAFRRPGRFDRILFVPPPDDKAKEAILEIKLKNKPISEINYKKVISSFTDYSGADMEAVIDIAIEGKLEQSFKTGFPEPISEKDLIAASKKHNPSTKEWFQSAKNFALYANESGIYDPILNFMKIKK